MYCKELDKHFDSKKAMFAELKANKELLIKARKAEIKTKSNTFKLQGLSDLSIKALPDMEDGYIYAVISNTNYMDSHNDVHLNGSMSKTASEQYGKVYYVADHDLKVNSIIATPKNVDMQLKTVDWKAMGYDYEGKTEALIFKVAKDKIMMEKATKLIESKEPLENSIRMQYVKIDLAINDPEEKSEYKTWSEVYPKLANKERADEYGYFWAVRELKIINEGSMVLFGSNSATPIESKEAVNNDTSKIEPSKDTQTEDEKSLQNENFYKSLI